MLIENIDDISTIEKEIIVAVFHSLPTPKYFKGIDTNEINQD
jgi:hypothetical protein